MLALIAAISVLLVSVNGQTDPVANCQLLADCINEGEGYFRQYTSLVIEREKVVPPKEPKIDAEKCAAKTTEKQRQLNLLDSEKRVFLASCVLSQSSLAKVNATQVAKFTTLIEAYKNSTINGSSPTEAVKLTACKCEQTQQISNYSRMVSSKRSMCSTLSSICSVYSTICGRTIYTKERQDLIAKISNATNEISELRQCNNKPLQPVTTTGAPTKETKVSGGRKKRQNEDDTNVIDENVIEELPFLEIVPSSEDD